MLIKQRNGKKDILFHASCIPFKHKVGKNEKFIFRSSNVVEKNALSFQFHSYCISITILFLYRIYQRFLLNELCSFNKRKCEQRINKCTIIFLLKRKRKKTVFFIHAFWRYYFGVQTSNRRKCQWTERKLVQTKLWWVVWWSPQIIGNIKWLFRRNKSQKSFRPFFNSKDFFWVLFLSLNLSMHFFSLWNIPILTMLRNNQSGFVYAYLFYLFWRGMICHFEVHTNGSVIIFSFHFAFILFLILCSFNKKQMKMNSKKFQCRSVNYYAVFCSTLLFRWI